MPDYAKYRKIARRQARKRGFWERRRQLQDEKNKRFQQMVADTGVQERSAAREQFKAMRAASVKESQEIAEEQAKGYYKPREDGKLEYSDAYFQNKAMEQAMKVPGVKFNSPEEFINSSKGKAMVATMQSRHGKFRNRVYKSEAEIAASLDRILQESRNKELSNSSKKQYTQLDRLLSFGLNKSEEMDTRSVGTVEGTRDPREFDTSTHEAYDKPLVEPKDPEELKGKLEDWRYVQEVDSNGDPIPGGRIRRAATDETERQVYVEENGKMIPSTGNWAPVDLEKTGQGAAKFTKFKSPMHDEEYVKRQVRDGKAVRALKGVYDVVKIKHPNPKDFIDRMIEATSNTVAAIVGFDGTEHELVTAYLDQTSPEDQATLMEGLGLKGVGINDAIHHGRVEQRKLFATLYLARALAGTGKLSVNAIDSARQVTEGGSGTSALARLGAAEREMEGMMQRSIISQAGRHNAQLIMEKDGIARDKAERALGYPVFSGVQYKKQMKLLNAVPDPEIVKELEDLYETKRIFRYNEHGILVVPTIVKFTKENGVDAYSISWIPQHYE